MSDWDGEHLTLDIDHINDNHSDNRIKILQILCPNCHSQTNNFNGKSKDLKEIDYESVFTKLKKRKDNRTKICQQCGKSYIGRGEKYCSRKWASIASVKETFTIDQVKDAAKTVHSFIQLGKLFNMTDNDIRKWLIRHNILDEVKT